MRWTDYSQAAIDARAMYLRKSAERLTQLRQELGLSGVVIEPNVGGGISRDQVWRSVHLFAQEVAPRLR